MLRMQLVEKIAEGAEEGAANMVAMVVAAMKVTAVAPEMDEEGR